MFRLLERHFMSYLIYSVRHVYTTLRFFDVTFDTLFSDNHGSMLLGFIPVLADCAVLL